MGGNAYQLATGRPTPLTPAAMRWAVMALMGVLAGVLGLVIARRDARPAVSERQASEMLPVIDACIDQHTEAALSGWGYLDPELRPRILCDAAIVEIRQDAARWRVGIVMNCGGFARRGNALVEGASGCPGIGEVMVLSRQSGAYCGVSLQVGPPALDQNWVDQNFSASAVSWLLSATPPTAPDPVTQARRAFGLPSHSPGRR
jgi:hypothetical protein